MTTEGWHPSDLTTDPVILQDEIDACRAEIQRLRNAPIKELDGVLLEADALVNGDRGAKYGPPWEDYGRTVAMFNAWSGRDLTTKEAVMFMVFVKLSRERHHPQRDNRVDAAGYIDCLDKVERQESGHGQADARAEEDAGAHTGGAFYRSAVLKD